MELWAQGSEEGSSIRPSHGSRPFLVSRETQTLGCVGREHINARISPTSPPVCSLAASSRTACRTRPRKAILGTAANRKTREQLLSHKPHSEEALGRRFVMSRTVEPTRTSPFHVKQIPSEAVRSLPGAPPQINQASQIDRASQNQCASLAQSEACPT